MCTCMCMYMCMCICVCMRAGTFIHLCLFLHVSVHSLKGHKTMFFSVTLHFISLRQSFTGSGSRQVASKSQQLSCLYFPLCWGLAFHINAGGWTPSSVLHSKSSYLQSAASPQQHPYTSFGGAFLSFQDLRNEMPTVVILFLFEDFKSRENKIFKQILW